MMTALDNRAELEGSLVRHRAGVYHFCRGYLRDDALAEDVCQQVFIEACVNLHRYDGLSTVRTWLFGIARHRVLDALKLRARREGRETDQALEVTPDPTPSAVESLDKRRLKRLLLAAIDRLPAQTRDMLLLRFQHGRSYEDIAKLYAMKPGTAQARVMRALRVLRRDLAANGWPGRDDKLDMTVKSRRQAIEPLVLLLDANPYGTDPLQLARECADIEDEVAYRGLRIEAKRAVSVDDAMRHMTNVDPAIVQFSGHGGDGAAIILEDARGAPQPVSASALAMMIQAAGRRVRVAVINACFGLAEASALTAVVDCVIGSDGPISDEAARAFAVRFYGALAAGRSVANAVAQGNATLVARNLAHGALPRCVTRAGVDAEAIVARSASRARREAR